MEKKTKIIIVAIFLACISTGVVGFKLYDMNVKRKEEIKKQSEKLAEENKEKEIINNYGTTASVTRDSKLYEKVGNDYKEVGTISKNLILSLEEITPSKDTTYFKVLNLGGDYYVNYADVEKSEAKKDTRYKSYIKFDKEVVTSDKSEIYADDKVAITLNKSLTLPVYKIDGDKYYVDYNGELMYTLKDKIKEVKNTSNNLEYASEMAVIVYHMIYDPSQGEECDQEICHSVTQFTSHMDYIKNNNFFTPTMSEFEDFMDGKIRLPKKSVLITIDDGWLGSNGVRILTEKQLHGTIFLISGAYDPQYYETEYVEAHSHTHNLHDTGKCPGGQGGGLKCLDQATILDDLAKSRKALHNTTALCYPFYEYNDYTISLLKQAGFTMGFAGYYANGTLKAQVGGDKYQIPRVTMASYSTVDYLASIIN